MIEKPRLLKNARSQSIFVLIVSAIAIWLMLSYPFQLGLDLKGGTQLIYEADLDLAIQNNELRPDVDRNAVMDEMVSIIAERADPEGVKEVLVARRGDQQILIELPAMSEAEAQAVEKRISTLGLLEFRAVATDDYRQDGVQFNLQEEKKRLTDWLDQNNGEMRTLLAADPDEIRKFHALQPDQGGVLVGVDKLKWFPRKIRPGYKNKHVWDHAMSQASGSYAVPLFTPEQYGASPDEMLARVEAEIAEHNRTSRDKIDPTSAGDRVFLIEYVPINMHEVGFKGEQLDSTSVRATRDEAGLPAVTYEFNTDTRDAYAEFSERYLNKQSAIILNGYVTSAPTFEGRIFGPGQIRGGFTQQEAADLVKVLKTGSLKVRPTRVSKIAIGATLGAESVRLGLISIVVGALLVLVFIAYYYRMSGIVAFIGLALNVFFILGIMQFIRATFTLPGLAGIVLTIGMAVDANILIYERIREEVKRGKALLQAVTAGFDRAMVTILDANITTFLVGVVLYNIGIGPIRGFAVTLMVGIVTSLFTAFFICRLVFHYLLETGAMKEFRAAEWFRNLRLRYLSYARPAIAASLVVILGGLIYVFTSVDKERMLGLDFTGGANLRVVLEQPITAAELRDRLAKHDEFNQDFPNPLINTSGGVEDGKAREFGLKLKLNDEKLARYNEAREQAKRENREFVPPYVGMLHEALDGLLVSRAFDKAAVRSLPEVTSVKAGEIMLHFATPVEVKALQEHLAGSLTGVAVNADDQAQSRDVFVEYQTASASTPDQVFLEVRDAIGENFLDASGQPVSLSNPIPEAEEIGGRMVGELRNAAIAAMVLSWFLIVMYIRLRFHEYRYGVAAVAALIHDVLVAFIAVVIANSLGIVNAEIDLSMIAAFLTIVGYSVNDTIVIFDRIRENISDAKRLGDNRTPFAGLLNLSINQTMQRTILTTGATLFVVIAQFVINRGSGSSLEGFSFALIVGMLAGTYSTIFIACPLVLWLGHETAVDPSSETTGTASPSVA